MNAPATMPMLDETALAHILNFNPEATNG